VNDQNKCKPISTIPTTCPVDNCVSCDDGSTCNECNAPFTLNKDNECQLCEEGTYFADKSCKGFSFLKWKWLITNKECVDKNCAFCPEDGRTCKICYNGFTVDGLNKCKPISTTCPIPNCASCDDDSICNGCNTPFTLVENNKCQLCKEGTYFKEGSCESISFFYVLD